MSQVACKEMVNLTPVISDVFAGLLVCRLACVDHANYMSCILVGLPCVSTMNKPLNDAVILRM